MLPPDRALRRLVADLAALHPDDAAAVLDALEGPQRGKVEVLLREFSEFGFAVAERPQVHVDISVLSPWLSEMMEGAHSGMTSHARARLHACALRLYPLVGTRQKPSFGLFRRLVAVFAVGP